jgi:hypothetical protein
MNPIQISIFDENLTEALGTFNRMMRAPDSGGLSRPAPTRLDEAW